MCEIVVVFVSFCIPFSRGRLAIQFSVGSVNIIDQASYIAMQILISPCHQQYKEADADVDSGAASVTKELAEQA